MSIVIIKYNAGNTQSVLYALQRIGAEGIVSDDIDTIQNADKIIFPGVGEASSAMHYLKEKGLDTIIPLLQQPFLGICLGMQLMCQHSAENDTKCLGIFNTAVTYFGNENSIQNNALKVPQIGWNTIQNHQTNLFDSVADNSYCYFVHGYYAALSKDTIATTHYGIPYSSALQKDNFYGVQFHPEKSASVGEAILKNFLTIS